jgi:AraC-like DNA-binding protein
MIPPAPRAGGSPPITGSRNRVRLDRFIAMYGRGRRRTMLDSALAAGFGSYAQFHRAFRRHMACSPAQYRRRLRNSD